MRSTVDAARGIDVVLLLGQPRLESVLSLVEALQILPPVDVAPGDMVQGLLHSGRETGVHQIREMVLHQKSHGKGGEGGMQILLLELGIAAVLDGRDDGRVGGRTADPLLLQGLHQRGFGVAGGRAGAALEALQIPEIQILPFHQVRKEDFLVFQDRFGIVGSLHVGPEKPRKFDGFAPSPKTGLGIWSRPMVSKI